MNHHELKCIRVGKIGWKQVLWLQLEEHHHRGNVPYIWNDSQDESGKHLPWWAQGILQPHHKVVHFLQ